MLKHEIRSAITVGNKVIHNFFSASPVMRSFPVDDLRYFKTSHGAEAAITCSS